MNFFIFSQKKAFLMFWKTETPEKFLKTKLFYTLGNSLYFRKHLSEIKKWKKKHTLEKCLIFREIELSSSKTLITLNKFPLGETGCLSNLYCLLAAQKSSFFNSSLFPKHSQMDHTWYSPPHCAAFV